MHSYQTEIKKAIPSYTSRLVDIDLGSCCLYLHNWSVRSYWIKNKGFHESIILLVSFLFSHWISMCFVKFLLIDLHLTFTSVLYVSTWGTGHVAQQLRALATIAQDTGLVSSTHVMTHTHSILHAVQGIWNHYRSCGTHKQM